MTSHPNTKVLAAWLDPERLELSLEKILDRMHKNMDPSLIDAVLFSFWLQTLYIEDLIRDPVDIEIMPELEKTVTKKILESSHPMYGNDFLEPLMNKIRAEIYLRFPRRILHQRDVERHTVWLIDELSNMLEETLNKEGTLERWRFELFLVWWCIRNTLDGLEENQEIPKPSLMVMKTIHEESLDLIQKRLNL